MTRTKLAMSATLSRETPMSPPGASVSWPVRVWQPLHELAKIVRPLAM
jgi:hypothetical protein